MPEVREGVGGGGGEVIDDNWGGEARNGGRGGGQEETIPTGASLQARGFIPSFTPA